METLTNAQNTAVVVDGAIVDSNVANIIRSMQHVPEEGEFDLVADLLAALDWGTRSLLFNRSTDEAECEEMVQAATALMTLKRDVEMTIRAARKME